MITKENAGKTLLEYRRDKNITQGEIARNANISLPTISGIESGSLTPHTMTIYKLEKYFESVGIK